MSDGPVHVVKLGGSLLDLPDLPGRLAAYLETLSPLRALLVVGGGSAADIVRAFDRAHGLDEQAAHWLAIRAMQLNAHLLVRGIRKAELVRDQEQCASAWRAQRMAVMDPLPWLEAEAQRGVTIPHRWQFTSDSIAAHTAQQLKAARLTLLKSTLPGESALTIAEAARLGLVDEELPRTAKGLAHVELINLRASSGECARCELRSPA